MPKHKKFLILNTEKYLTIAENKNEYLFILTDQQLIQFLFGQPTLDLLPVYPAEQIDELVLLLAFHVETLELEQPVLDENHRHVRFRGDVQGRQHAPRVVLSVEGFQETVDLKGV